MMVFIGMRRSLYDKTGTAQFFDLEGTHVQRGRYNGVEVDEVRRLVDEGSRVYRVILTIWHLVLVVIGHTFPKGIVIEIPPKLRRTVIPIWPVIKSTVWPPPEPIDEIGGMDVLNKAFT